MPPEPLTPRPASPPEPGLMTETERFLAIRRIGFFDSLDDDLLGVIAFHAREELLRAGTILFAPDSPPTRLHIVVDGAVDVERDGRHVVTVLPGYGVGSLGLFTQDHDDSVARAKVDTIALALDYDVFESVMEDHFEFVVGPLRRLATGISEMLANIGGDRVLGQPTEELPQPAPLDLVQRIFQLRRGEVFAKSSVHAVAEFAEGMQELRLQPGDVLWREGDVADGVFCIVHGSVRVSPRGGTWSETAHPESFIGGLATLAEQPRRGTATALTQVVGLKAPPELLLDVMEDNFDMARHFLRMLAQMYVKLQNARADKRTERGDTRAA